MAKDPDNSAAAEEKPDPNLVSVIATGSFFRDENFAGPLLQAGDPFTTTRARAVELRGNGLIKYTDEAAEKEASADDPLPSTDNGRPVITTRSFRKVKT